MSDPEQPGDRLTAQHWLLLLVLAAVQFTHIVDFMIIIPLGPQLKDRLGIDPIRQFPFVLSSYGFAAFLAGFLLARSLDLFDRRHALLFLYAGFTAGTFLCAFAPSYAWLLAGRVVAGGFGGVAGAAVLTIVGDAFPLARRGTATGVVMSAFSLASIFGVPAGLLLGELFPRIGWRATFIGLGLVSIGVWLLALLVLPSLRAHLTHSSRRASLREVLTEPAYLRAYLLMFCLNLSGFLLFSYMINFLVDTVGVAEKRVKLVYLIGGLATVLSMNAIGRLSDHLPKRIIFQIACGLFVVPTLLLTHLQPGASLPGVLTLTTVLMVLGSGRGVPVMALMTAVARPNQRGTFLSVNSSVAQLAITLAPLLTSLFLSGGTEGQPLIGYDRAGWVSSALALLCVGLVMLLRPVSDGEAGRREGEAPAEPGQGSAGPRPLLAPPSGTDPESLRARP